MSDYNRVILVGRLTRQIEMRYTASGIAVADIGLAVNRKYTTQNERREEVCFVNCVAWGRVAESASKYLSKGSPVLIEGRLTLDEWDAKDGSKRTALKVTIENLQFLGSRGESQKSESRVSEPEPGSDRAPAGPDDDNDVPF